MPDTPPVDMTVNAVLWFAHANEAFDKLIAGACYDLSDPDEHSTDTPEMSWIAIAIKLHQLQHTNPAWVRDMLAIAVLRLAAPQPQEK